MINIPLSSLPSPAEKNLPGPCPWVTTPCWSFFCTTSAARGDKPRNVRWSENSTVSPNNYKINLRSGSIFVSLCNNIPAGEGKTKCMRTAKIGPDLRLL